MVTVRRAAKSSRPEIYALHFQLLGFFRLQYGAFSPQETSKTKRLQRCLADRVTIGTAPRFFKVAILI